MEGYLDFDKLASIQELLETQKEVRYVPVYKVISKISKNPFKEEEDDLGIYLADDDEKPKKKVKKGKRSDEEGFINVPLLLYYALGHGKYGNDIHLRFENITEYFQDVGSTGYSYGNWLDYENPEHHTYTLTVMEPGDNGLVRREFGTGTFDVDGYDASTDYYSSSFFEDVTNDLETGSQRIKSKVSKL